MNLEPLHEVIGARVTGLTLTQIPSAAEIEWLEDALERFGVLVFENQNITPAQQVEFTRAFGTLEVSRRQHARHPSHPEVFVIGNSGNQLVTFSPNQPDGELEWHTDHIHLTVPARASLLYALEIPPSGGDTAFACLYCGFDALSPEEQAHCEAMVAVHSIRGLRRYLLKEHEGGVKDDYEEVQHEVRWPLVRRHPRSGRRGLYFGAKVTVGIDGMSGDEAARLVRRLTEVTTQAQFQYRHRWQVGDAVLWDNRRVVHAGTYYDYNGPARHLHRTTLAEDQPVA